MTHHDHDQTHDEAQEMHNHGHDDEEKASYVCKECGMEFASAEELEEHNDNMHAH